MPAKKKILGNRNAIDEGFWRRGNPQEGADVRKKQKELVSIQHITKTQGGKVEKTQGGDGKNWGGTKT